MRLPSDLYFFHATFLFAGARSFTHSGFAELSGMVFSSRIAKKNELMGQGRDAKGSNYLVFLRGLSACPRKRDADIF